jgi:hypothetical protein
MRTPMIERHEQALRALWSEVPSETKERWGDEYFNEKMARTVKNPFILSAEMPHKVVKVLRHAVMSTAPLIRYRPGWQSSLFFFPLSMLPAWIADYILIKSNASKVLPAGLLEQQD